jgi:hypothetical protein
MSATMAAGTYYINGGTFSIQGGGSVSGSGVMIYLANGATVNIANGVTVTLSPPSASIYQGVLFYRDRTATSPGTSFFAGANQHLTGSLYFPNSLLNIDKGTNTSTMAVVAGRGNFQGGANIQAGTAAQTGISTATTNKVYLVQ